MIEDFPEHLRPYTDEQIPAAMQRIAAHRYFPDVAAMIFPGITPAEAISKVLEVKTVYQFQMEWMYAFNKRVIESTMESFTYDFSPGIRPDVGYLYISNHRDIILDTSLLQMIFVDQGLPTSMITYGDNLIVNQLADDLARSNKMFKVVRQGNKRELFKNSVLLSEFLRSCIRQGDSCWIAQRNGRTKDGLDKTAPALVKMMGMSGMRGAAATSDGVAAGGGLNELVENYAALNIVPVAISYEYESCDFLKTKELLAA
ncbi:MAG TPA: acyltransferase, partial [Bacteroidales bacterium]|nr:acyltransferase [Bacteroidales bacterium]